MNNDDINNNNINDNNNINNIETEKQRRIREIYRDSTISNQEKTRRVFEIMNPTYGMKLKKEDDRCIHGKNKILNECIECSGIECKHYDIKCRIECIKCKKWYKCRHCHNENELDHEYDRYNVEKMQCIKCQEIQKPNQICIKCGEEMAKSYCNICYVWTDKDIYHCNECKICRVHTYVIENGEKKFEKHVHCKTCGTCVKEEHECKEDLLGGKCPICCEIFVSSIKEIMILQCNHRIHKECMKEYIKSDYRCPTCHKSVGDLSDYWEIIDEHLMGEILPEPYRNWETEIQCIDCEKKSTVKFHYQYHKCPECKGYNTQKLKIHRNETNNNESNDENSNESNESSENGDENV